MKIKMSGLEVGNKFIFEATKDEVEFRGYSSGNYIYTGREGRDGHGSYAEEISVNLETGEKVDFSEECDREVELIQRDSEATA